MRDMKMEREFIYVLVGNGYMAMPVKSSLSYLKMKDHIRTNSRKIHKNSHETVFSWGTIDFVNPEIMMVSDFAQRSPALIAMK